MLEVQIRIKSTAFLEYMFQREPGKIPAVVKDKLKIKFPTIAKQINCKFFKFNPKQNSRLSCKLSTSSRGV